jgi:hypothetical protein
MSRCATCGQPLPAAAQVRREGSAEELLTLLRGQDRYAYRINGTAAWTVTRLRGAPHFSAKTIEGLVRAGRLAPVYPGTEAEHEAYGLSERYAEPAYLRWIAKRRAEIESRRKARPVARERSEHLSPRQVEPPIRDEKPNPRSVPGER